MAILPWISSPSAHLTAHKLHHCMMVRDVTTRWNSTYNMLEFAVEYRSAIDAMTAIRDLDLHKYELGPSEWKIAAELRDVLKVGFTSTIYYLLTVDLDRSLKMPLFSFLEEHLISSLSFLLWTISTRSLPHHRTAHTSSRWPFMQLSLLERML